MDWVDIGLALIVLMLLALLLWMTWLYVLQYRQNVTITRDRDRLIRRIGLYHNLPLTIPQETLPPIPSEVTVPPAFRMKRPTPPLRPKG